MFESCSIYFLIGWLSAISSALGHELVHKKNFCDKMVGQFIFSKRFYGHDFYDHVNSHHKKVGTPDDHSTAFYNESLWEFIPRSMWSQLKGVYKNDMERLTRDKNISGIQYITNHVLLRHMICNFMIVSLI
jgi:alkane 1-monooxygenase